MRVSGLSCLRMQCIRGYLRYYPPFTFVTRTLIMRYFLALLALMVMCGDFHCTYRTSRSAVLPMPLEHYLSTPDTDTIPGALIEVVYRDSVMLEWTPLYLVRTRTFSADSCSIDYAPAYYFTPSGNKLRLTDVNGFVKATIR